MASFRSVSSASIAVALLLAACGSGPSKRQALNALKRDVDANAFCTLPIDILSQLRMQYTSKGVCVAKGEPTTPRVLGCMEALAAAKITQLKPAAYMREWPDDVAARSLSDVPAYERKARDLVYAQCFELTGDRLRRGMFDCAKATPEKVLDTTSIDDAHADVKFSQTLTPIDELDAIERACAGLSKPPMEATVRLEKVGSGWRVAPSSSPGVGH